jgi:ABC-type Zn2+ transport system substrate-binding protein/surface adhesin
MAKTKPTSAAVDRLVDRISHLKRRLGRVRAIAVLKDHEAWPELKGLLEDVKDMHDRGVKAVVEFGDHLDDRDRCRQIDQNRASRDAFAWVVQLVEQPEDEADKLAANLKDLEGELAEARATIQEFGLEPAGKKG